MADAGPFGAWLAGMQRAIRDGGESDVPCDGCTACCRASQFIHVGPEETETLARIPPDHLVPAPGLPRGHLVMGYDERGHCPMLVDDRCSIYDARPRACRTYDCRVFAATGVAPEPRDLAARVEQWEFSFASDDERVRYDACHAHADELHAAGVRNPTERAVRSVSDG